MIVSHPTSFIIGKRKCAPIPERMTFGSQISTQPFIAIRRSQPMDAQVRMIVPRFPGSRMLSQITVIGRVIRCANEQESDRGIAKIAKLKEK